MSATQPPLILTLKLDASTFAVLNNLREAHFPPERNFLAAHITLFHALPGDQELAITQTLEDTCLETPGLALNLPKPRFMGRGVAVEVHSPALVQLRQELATTWQAWLTPQDQQGYRPHVTIQNKVSAEQARQLYQQLQSQWQPLAATGEGLLLWRYLGGPWELLQEFPFQPLRD